MTVLVIFQMVFFIVFFIIISTLFKNVSKNASKRKINIKYQQINSHYRPETFNRTAPPKLYQNDSNSQMTMSDDHNHAYEHKVEPIEEASVIEQFEERKEAYRERKQEMKENLHKSSYSKIEESIASSNGGRYKDMHMPYGRNGENGALVGDNEVSIACAYCGAVNIVPASRRTAFACHFCRQELQ